MSLNLLMGERHGPSPRGLSYDPRVQPATVTPVGKSDEARVIATLVSAFIADPVERWLFPDPLEYLTHFGAFVAAFGEGGFASETVFELGDFAAVAIWIPPGAEPNGDAIVAALSASVPSEKHADTFSVLEQMDAVHPTGPHWYLPWLGADAAHQGSGLGAELLRHGLARVDADRAPAFLETPNPRTVPFYERHGFAVSSVSQAGACPPVTSMWRPAS
jgi:GNAT superfamily N-acetyltransferase